jgi:hypothetical protein
MSHFRLISCIALCAIIAGSIWALTRRKINTNSAEEKVSVDSSTRPEIERLTREVKERRNETEFWDTWNIRLLFIAGLAALFLVVTAIGVSRSNRRLADASDQLDKTKDRVLQADLKAKDDEIASLNNKTASAQLDIAQANERASKADKAAAEAKLNLELLKSPRTLKNTPQVGASLKPFLETEYLFSGVGADEESVALLREVDGLLQQSGWKRVPARGKFPALNIFGDNSADSVSEAIQSGVVISVEAPEDLSHSPLESLPTHVRAAITLNLDLQSNIFPEPREKPKVNLLIGDGKTVQISIGRKPI